MEKDENKLTHSLRLDDRQYLSLTGVSDVDGFNEEEVLIICTCGELTVKGELLHIEQLNIEAGILTLSGNVKQLTYSESKKNSTVLKRLFGG